MLALIGGGAAAESRQTYTYDVEHPRYGNIGTYTDTVTRDGDTRRIDTKMRIAVKVLGITMFREDADRTETWRGGRLVGFDGVTVTNGKSVKIHGRAQGDRFDITTPSGTTHAPAGVYPSTPWSAALPNPSFMMSTRSGQVLPAKETGPEPAVVSLYGAQIPVRHYEIQTDKRQDVWLNARGIPVRFRTVEDGTPIDFVLSAEQVAQLRRQ
jgi:hypothetical protein